MQKRIIIECLHQLETEDGVLEESRLGAFGRGIAAAGAIALGAMNAGADTIGRDRAYNSRYGSDAEYTARYDDMDRYAKESERNRDGEGVQVAGMSRFAPTCELSRRDGTGYRINDGDIDPMHLVYTFDVEGVGNTPEQARENAFTAMRRYKPQIERNLGTKFQDPFVGPASTEKLSTDEAGHSVCRIVFRWNRQGDTEDAIRDRAMHQIGYEDPMFDQSAFANGKLAERPGVRLPFD